MANLSTPKHKNLKLNNLKDSLISVIPPIDEVDQATDRD